MLSASTLTLAIIYIMLLCDNIIAGLYIGTAGVAAINAVTPVTGIVSFFSTIISIGTGIIYSREIGAMRKRRADEFFGQGLLLSIVLSAVTAFLLAACRDIYFSTNEITGEVYTLASAYYRWMPLNAILFIMNSFVTKLVYTDGDEKNTTFSYVVQIGGNLDADDIDEGFDDYIMVERYELDGTKGSAFVVVDAVDKGFVDDTTEGLREVDGGQLLLKRKEWTDGDIRRFITEALDFVGYGAASIDDLYKYLVYIASEK